ncbi:heterochromatin protein 1 [Plasmodium sp. gorilla clade G3]|nr:heterochromatin protein 1 [Plasmodium sp. gorilla clade G3]
MTGSDEEFEIGDILEIKKKKNGFIYLVKWKGYSDDENTWEPESNLIHLTTFKKKMESLKTNYLSKANETNGDGKILKNHLLPPTQEEDSIKSKGRSSLAPRRKMSRKNLTNKLENKKNLSLSDNSLKKSDEEDNESVKHENHVNDGNLLNVEDVYSVRIKNKKLEFLASLKNESPQWVEETNIRRTGHLNIKVNDFKRYVRRKKSSRGNRIVIKNLHNVGDELYISVIHNINNKEIHSLYPSKVIEYIYPQELLNFLLSRLRYRTA